MFAHASRTRRPRTGPVASRRAGGLGPALLLGLALLAAGAPPARGQEPARIDRVRAAFSADAALAIERTVQDARAQGLPTEPLVNKALEGASKGIPPDRVVAAVRQLSEQLGRARAVLRANGPAGEAEVTAVADALRRGVPEDAVRALRAGPGQGASIALAVHTLADLLEQGVPAPVALDVLAAWQGRGGRPDELGDLSATVDRLVRQGVVPARAGAAVAAAVRAGEGLRGLGPSTLGLPPAGRGNPVPPVPPGDRGKRKRGSGG